MNQNVSGNRKSFLREVGKTKGGKKDNCDSKEAGSGRECSEKDLKFRKIF